MHLVAVVFDQLARQAVLLVNDATHLTVHLLHGLLAHVGRLGDRTPQENFAFVFSIDHGAERVRHTVAGNHVACDMGSALEIVAGARGHLVHEHLFSDTPAKQHANLVQHVLAVIAVAVLRRQTHGHAQSPTTRDDGDFVNRIAFGQQFANQGVARLMVGRVSALTLGHHHALTLGPHQNLVLGLLEILHLHRTRIAPGSHQRGLVAQVGQVSTRHAGGAAGNHTRIDILPQRHFSHVHIENLLTTANIRQRDINLPVKAARAQ